MLDQQEYIYIEMGYMQKILNNSQTSYTFLHKSTHKIHFTRSPERSTIENNPRHDLDGKFHFQFRTTSPFPLTAIFRSYFMHFLSF